MSLRARMPFSGVRISWLMTARKSDLAAFACSAASLATTSSSVRAATSLSRPSTCAAIRASRSRIPESMASKPAIRSATSPSVLMSTLIEKSFVS